MSVQLKKRLFTAAEYEAMERAGILTEDDRVELIEGEIIQKMPIGSRHAACVLRLTRAFSQGVQDRALVSVQNPVRLGEYSEPEPDLVLVRPRADFYAGAHPGPADVLLLVEVADTALPFDREVKLPLYGRFAIPEVWIVDLEGGRVEVFRDPSPAGYRTEHVYHRGDQALAPQALPDLHVTPADILP